MISAYARNAIVLGLLAAVGPFAIDMYLPALPTIAADLGASTAATQMTLTAFFIGFGGSQIVYGPVSDMTGRKPPLYFGLTLFIIGAVGSALSPSIGWLIGCRVVQGIGAASVMVVPRAVIRDLHTGVEATRLMATVMLVLSVSPILAPLAGSALIVPFGWRAVFIAATLAALLGFVLTAFVLPETWPAEQRVKSEIASVLAGYGLLLRDARFLGLTFIGGLGMASFFAYLASASFIYMRHFGLTPIEFSLAFSVNAIGFIGSSQFSANLGARFGMARRGKRRRRLCGDGSPPLRRDARRCRQPGGADDHALPRLRLPRPGHSGNHGALARGAWADRRHGLGARRHAADGCRRLDDRRRQPVFRRNGAADGDHHRALGGWRLRAQPADPARRAYGRATGRVGRISEA